VLPSWDDREGRSPAREHYREAPRRAGPCSPAAAGDADAARLLAHRTAACPGPLCTAAEGSRRKSRPTGRSRGARSNPGEPEAGSCPGNGCQSRSACEAGSPVLKTAPPAVPPARVSPGQQPVVKQAPDVKQKPEPPAPVAMKPAVKQAPDGQQKPAPAAPANPQRAPAPGPIVTAKPNVPAQPPAKQPAVMTRGGPEGASASTLITTLKTQTLPDADRRSCRGAESCGHQA